MIFDKTARGIKKARKFLTSSKEVAEFSKFSNREIILNEISWRTAQEVDELIRYWNEYDCYNLTGLSSRKSIKIFINATDGDLASALSIVDSIKLSRTPVDTINTRVCIGNALLVYLAGHKRYCYPSATFAYKYQNFLEEVPDAEEEADSPRFNKASVEENQFAIIKSLFIEKTKITESKFNKHIDTGFWFSAQTATDQFICNEILKEHYLFK